MTQRTWPFGERAAIELLRRTLLTADHRLAWMRHARRPSHGGEINRLAVARFLVACGVWGTEASVAQVKDTVYRALSPDPGRQLLTPDTLTRFIDGFGLSETEAANLWALLAATDPADAAPITGQIAAGEVSPPERPNRVAREHETVSLHEFHYLGPDGIPVRHRTVQVIRSLVDRLVSYPYRIDTDAADVRVVRGGYIGPHDWTGGGLYTFEIRLSRSLRRGETASIEYETTFSYAEPPAPQFRRGARGRVTNLELYLRFDRGRLPRNLWWATWSDYVEAAAIIHEERIRLDTEHSAHRYLPYIERTVVGFHWDWP